MPYTKNVKFNYFQITNNSLKSPGIKTNFSFTDWAAHVKRSGLIKQHIELSKCNAKIEYVGFSKQSSLWKLRVLRLVDINIPQTSKSGHDAEDLDLGDDEYLGYDCNLIYDEANGIAMIQRNRNSVSIERLTELLNKTNPSKDSFISVLPIKNNVGLKKIVSNGKKIEVSFANITNTIPETLSPLSNIINSFHILKGVSGAITIGVGRGKDIQIVKGKRKDKKVKVDRFLDAKETQQLIEDIMCNRDIITRGIVTLRDEEETNVELVDLFDDVFLDIIQFQLEERRTLGLEYVMNEMMLKYKRRQGKIINALKSYT